MNQQSLSQKLIDLNQKNYSLYKSIKGAFSFPFFKLQIDHIQGDPFAAPSKFRIFITPSVHQIPSQHLASKVRMIPCRDFITRAFANSARKYSRNVGTGKGGQIGIDCPSQQILDRSSCPFSSDNILEIRFTVGMPANGRRILGSDAARILCETLPLLVESCLYPNLDHNALTQHIDCYEDNYELRRELDKYGLVSFVANGSHLARESGNIRPTIERKGLQTIQITERPRGSSKK